MNSGTESEFEEVIDSDILIPCVSNQRNVLVTSGGDVQSEHSMNSRNEFRSVATSVGSVWPFGL